MKRFKKMMALVIAMVMIIGTMSAMTATAAVGDYTITVKNNNTNISINGKTYTAYKLFDVTYTTEASNSSVTSTTDPSAYDTATSGYAYTINTASPLWTTAAIKSILEEYFTFTATSDANVYSVAAKGGTLAAADAMALTDALYEYLGTTIPVAATSAAAANETTTIQPADAGYYIVKGDAVNAHEGGDNNGLSALVSLTTTHPNALVNPKADATFVTKEVDEPLDTTDPVENQKAIGDTVNYTIKSTVPNMTGYDHKYFFIATDKLTGGLTYGKDLAVKLGSATLASPTDYYVEYSLDGTAYTDSVPASYAEGSELYIKITFVNFIQYKNGKYFVPSSSGTDKVYIGGTETTGTWTDGSNKEGQAIEITYSAILNDSAVITDGGNENSVNLTYSNNPNNEGNGDSTKPDQPDEDDVTGKTPDHTVKTYVTGIELVKVDGTDSTKKLQGVKFNVTGTAINDIKETTYTRYAKVPVDASAEVAAEYTYYLLKDGTYTNVAPTSLTTSQYETGNPEYKLESGVAFSKDAGEAVSYQVTTDAQGIVSLTGLKEGTYTITEIETNAGYNLLENPITITVTAKKDADGKFDGWEYKKDNGTATSDQNANYRYEFTVENNQGSILPSTGGIGTTIFYVIGAILVLGAGILLVTRRRMNAN